MRSKENDELDSEMVASHLLRIIAKRAKRTNDFSSKGLKIGEALIGDYRNYGMTMRQYRTAKMKLEKWKFATFRATNKGTIATLLDTYIYDINENNIDNQQDNQETIKRQSRDNQETTNKKLRSKESEEVKNTDLKDFDQFWQVYPRRICKFNAKKAWVKIKEDKSIIIEAVKKQKEADMFKLNDPQFIPHPATWLNEKRWEEEIDPPKVDRTRMLGEPL